MWLSVSGLFYAGNQTMSVNSVYELLLQVANSVVQTGDNSYNVDGKDIRVIGVHSGVFPMMMTVSEDVLERVRRGVDMGEVVLDGLGRIPTNKTVGSGVTGGLRVGGADDDGKNFPTSTSTSNFASSSSSSSSPSSSRKPPADFPPPGFEDENQLLESGRGPSVGPPGVTPTYPSWGDGDRGLGIPGSFSGMYPTPDELLNRRGGGNSGRGSNPQAPRFDPPLPHNTFF